MNFMDIYIKWFNFLIGWSFGSMFEYMCIDVWFCFLVGFVLGFGIFFYIGNFLKLWFFWLLILLVNNYFSFIYIFVFIGIFLSILCIYGI